MLGLFRICWTAARPEILAHSFSPSIPLPLNTRSSSTCSMPSLPTLPARKVSPSGSSVSFLRSRYFPNSSGMFIKGLLSDGVFRTVLWTRSTPLIQQVCRTVNQKSKESLAAARSLALAPLLGPPVAPVLALPGVDVAVVLLQGLREDVGAVVAAHEIEEGHVGRPGGGDQAGEPRRADRPRREPGVAIGVVGRLHPQVLAADVAVPAAQALQGVDDGGVRGEADPPVQPVAVDGGDQRP